ncbi:uncharacterized protein LOC124543701 [Vanessa cardui]|uniref:uncharacterized protein LOC124543701 n=1 Tax=Vanessa cardui TaxID=171605 RepID=UPI001F13B5D0|nr:uncharacterized protein LOC124543701 [Vanessa cardui]
MFKYMCLVACFLGSVLDTNANAVYVVKPCKADDKACLISSAQETVPHFTLGNEELGIPSTDPLFVHEIKSKQPNLNIEFRDNVIRGASKTKIMHLERDVEKQTVKMTLGLPLHITGKYDLQGKILFLQAVGNGDYELKTNNMVFTIDAKYKVIEKKGIKHWKITGFKYTYDLVEKVHIKFDNLFGGDESKAKPINDVLNESWREIIEEMGNPIIEPIVTAYIDVIKKWLLVMPTDKLEIV